MNVCARCRASHPAPLWRWVPFHGERLLPNPYRQQNPSRGFGAASPWRDPGVKVTWEEVAAWYAADPTRTASLTIARHLAALERDFSRAAPTAPHLPGSPSAAVPPSGVGGRRVS